MKKNLKLKALAVAVLAVIGAQSAMADISENANITILANNDNSGSTPTYSEGVFIRSNEGNAATATFQSNGTASINGTNTSLTGVTTLINAAGNLTLTGNTDNTEGSEGVRIKSNTAGAASINLQTNGLAYINASSQIRINAEPDTSTGSVLIGNGRGNNAISGVTNSISGTTNSISGTTNSISGTTNNIDGGANGTNNITAGINNITGTTNTITGTTNTIIGNTNINDSINSATNINTGTSTGNVVIGNAANSTSLNSATNNIGSNLFATTNNIGVNSTAANVAVTAGNTLSNNMGTGTGKTVNNLGNANAATLVNATAGTAQLTLANNNAQLTVPNTAAQSNGVLVNNTSTSMTGGTSSATRLTMTDNAATFSRVSNGAPITVTGVANGRNDMDAVNVRQFAGAVAAVAAQANVPALAAGQDKSIGLGVANFMGKTGLAMGMNIRGQDNATYKLSVSSGVNGGSSTVLGAGAAWAF